MFSFRDKSTRTIRNSDRTVRVVGKTDCGSVLQVATFQIKIHGAIIKKKEPRTIAVRKRNHIAKVFPR